MKINMQVTPNKSVLMESHDDGAAVTFGDVAVNGPITMHLSATLLSDVIEGLQLIQRERARRERK